jgi:pyrroline-5-carboxylate reductase
LRAGLLTRDRVLASDPEPAARQTFEQATGVRAVGDNHVVVGGSDVLVLAVKPQQVAAVCEQLGLHDRHLVVSVVAGASVGQLVGWLKGHRRLVRLMPNTPCLVGASASAYAPGPGASAEDLDLVRGLLSAVGLAVAVPEKLLDAVTGLSASGPAFVFQVIEALSDGGVRVGLPRDVATALAAQTVFGAAKMVLETGQHPGVLKDQVASPGGTTIAGLHALERGGLRAALMDAVEAAAPRAAELGQGQ